jgi:hypothetical protein
MTMAALALLVCGVILFGISQRFRRHEELGSVSTQWLSEYRQNHES